MYAKAILAFNIDWEPNGSLICFKIYIILHRSLTIINNGDSMKIRLGYVSICNSLDISPSKTITYTNYIKMNNREAKEKFNKIIDDNLNNFEKILRFNQKNNITFYRMTSKLIPLITHPSLRIKLLKRHQRKLKKIGNYINKYNLRVDSHPDQFCVLNSTKINVVNSSIKILEFHQYLFDLMGIDGKIILHVGSGEFGKNQALIRFKNNFQKLPEKLKKLIIIENDDKVFNIIDVLELTNQLNIPMVVDIHHHFCNNNGEKIEDYIVSIFKTWNNQKYPPKIHFSSPKNIKDYRSHSDYININDFTIFIEKVKFLKTDFDIMIEAKQKDEALFRIIRLLKYKNKYKIKKNEIFIK